MQPSPDSAPDTVASETAAPLPPAGTVLVLPRALRSELEAHARDAYPHEACGVLIGTPGALRAEVRRVTRARNLNVARARDRYELDPLDLLAAEDAARAAGLEVLGIWHTHPDHPARPSETDRAAAWEGWSYVILAVDQGGAGDARSFRLSGERFHEEELLSP